MGGGFAVKTYSRNIFSCRMYFQEEEEEAEKEVMNSKVHTLFFQIQQKSN